MVPTMGPSRGEAIAAYYTQLVVDNRAVLEFDIERIVVDDNCVVTEGWIRAINKGAIAKARGWTVDDDTADYLVTQRVVLFGRSTTQGRWLARTATPTSTRERLAARRVRTARDVHSTRRGDELITSERTVIGATPLADAVANRRVPRRQGPGVRAAACVRRRTRRRRSRGDSCRPV